MKKIIISILIVVSFLPNTLVPFAEAHRSGCHRWHSCPSDSGSYTCGDAGYPCLYPTYPASGGVIYPPSGYYKDCYDCPLKKVPDNSYTSGIGWECNDGYVKRNDVCISNTDDCKLEYGNYVYGTKNESGGSLCYCIKGYEWNDEKTGCQEIADLKLSKILSGNILLQVESNGEAWYIYPDDMKRYYLGRPADAFAVMRRLGLGTTHQFISSNSVFPDYVSGKILLDVEQNGEAYYIYPKNKKAYYLGRPEDAFRIMRELGLGITNDNINKIEQGNN